MSNLKFRAWYEKEQRWLHGYEPGKSGCDILGETICLGQWMKEIPLKDYDKVSVEQYIGHKDRNGVEIYQNDVVLCYKKQDKFNNNVPPTLIPGYAKAAITWRNIDLCWCFDQFEGSNYFFYSPVGSEFNPWAWLDHNYEWIEVIGNIHDNPELDKRESVKS